MPKAAEKEPDIYNAIRFGSTLKNVKSKDSAPRLGVCSGVLAGPGRMRNSQKLLMLFTSSIVDLVPSRPLRLPGKCRQILCISTSGLPLVTTDHPDQKNNNNNQC